MPKSAFGPRLCSTVAMLTGLFHLSRRQVVQLLWDLFGVSISLGGCGPDCWTSCCLLQSRGKRVMSISPRNGSKQRLSCEVVPVTGLEV